MKLLTVAETQEHLRLSKPTVYTLLNSGQLPSLRIGRRRLVREQDLERFIAERVEAGRS